MAASIMNTLITAIPTVVQITVATLSRSMVVKAVMTIQVICIFDVVKDVFVVKPFACLINQVRFDKSDTDCQHQNPTFSNVFTFVVNPTRLSKKSSKSP